jgi:hypothetical protein
VDGVILGCLVVAGFFYFNLVQIISILMGDETHVLVRGVSISNGN